MGLILGSSVRVTFKVASWWIKTNESNFKVLVF